MYEQMIFREAILNDISQMQVVRNLVKENKLSDPSVIKDEDYKDYMVHRGKGWVCEYENKIIGFAIVGLKERNIWALFVDPEHEAKGIGKKLQTLMLNWYFKQTQEPVWLGTAPHTRAELFYKKTGWFEAGSVNKGETKFEMTFENWNNMYHG